MKDIICVKDCIMKNGDKCFTKGKTYHPYKYSYISDPFDNYVTITVAAKDDSNVRHIIKQLSPKREDNFFNQYFKEV